MKNANGVNKKFTASDVKKLRELTGAGMMETNKALEETGGDLEKAQELLRRKGILKASKRAGREARQGIIDAYIHPGGRIGVMLEVNCETDFVARNQEFKNLVHDLALHIAASAPIYISREEVPYPVIEKEKEIYHSSAPSKPGAVVEKIVAGRLEKFYKEACLLEQAFVKNPDITVQGLINQKIATIGENIKVQRFTRYVLGE